MGICGKKLPKIGKKRLQFAYNNVIIKTLNNAFVIESGASHSQYSYVDYADGSL